MILSAKVGLALLSDSMAEDPRDFEQKFSEIIGSEDLKKFSDNFKKDSLISYKDLVLIQQALIESLSHISDIMFYKFAGQNDLVDFSDPTQNNILSALYKISIDFNDLMIEYIVEDFDDDEDDEDDE